MCLKMWFFNICFQNFNPYTFRKANECPRFNRKWHLNQPSNVQGTCGSFMGEICGPFNTCLRTLSSSESKMFFIFLKQQQPPPQLAVICLFVLCVFFFWCKVDFGSIEFWFQFFLGQLWVVKLYLYWVYLPQPECNRHQSYNAGIPIIQRQKNHDCILGGRSKLYLDISSFERPRISKDLDLIWL